MLVSNSVALYLFVVADVSSICSHSTSNYYLKATQCLMSVVSLAEDVVLIVALELRRQWI